MHFNNMKKFVLGALIIIGVAACSMATSMDATVEREAEATTKLKEIAKAPGKLEPDDVIRVKNDIWLGDTSEIEFEGEPIPAYLEKPDGVTLISSKPLTMLEIVNMIQKTTSLKVRFAPQLEKDLLKGEGDSSANKDDLEQVMDPDKVSVDKMLVSYKGPLSGLLDEISANFGIWWKYEKGEIFFYKFITRTFVLFSLPSKPKVDVQVGGSASGEGGDSSLSLTSGADIDLWQNIETSIKAMIDSSAKLTTDSANGTISLTATPNDIRRVASFINEQNNRLSRQVAISVKVFQVAVNDSDQYGMNFKALFENDDTTVRNLVVQSIPGVGDITNNLTMGIVSGDVSVDATMQALSKSGITTLVTSGTVTTLNNKPAPIQVVRKENYISQLTRTNTSSTGVNMDSNFTTETKEISTGFTMDVLPRILEHGRMLLMFNLTLSDLVSMEKVIIGDPALNNFVQNPVIESRGFTQEVALRSGESLVLTGFERVENMADKTGVGSATNSILGGTATATKTRSVLVIVLTPVVLASPLSPESRMRDYN